MFSERGPFDENREEPSEEERVRLSGYYENEIEQMLDPTLDKRRRIARGQEREEVATFPQMLPPFHINGVVKLLNDNGLVDASSFERAYGILAYVEAKSIDDCKAYQHVFREFLPV